jgi:hypothetical protein
MNCFLVVTDEDVQLAKTEVSCPIGRTVARRFGPDVWAGETAFVSHAGARVFADYGPALLREVARFDAGMRFRAGRYSITLRR